MIKRLLLFLNLQASTVTFKKDEFIISICRNHMPNEVSKWYNIISKRISLKKKEILKFTHASEQQYSKAHLITVC